MLNLLVVGAGGFAGAVARYALSGWVHDRLGESMPVGTLVVNVAGSFVIGVLMALVVDRQVLAPEARLLVIVGFLGSFTTFSTFSYETLQLVREGSWRLAVWNVGLNVVLGIGAVLLGAAAARAALR